MSTDVTNDLRNLVMTLGAMSRVETATVPELRAGCGVIATDLGRIADLVQGGAAAPELVAALDDGELRLRRVAAYLRGASAILERRPAGTGGSLDDIEIILDAAIDVAAGGGGGA